MSFDLNLEMMEYLPKSPYVSNHMEMYETQPHRCLKEEQSRLRE